MAPVEPHSSPVHVHEDESFMSGMPPTGTECAPAATSMNDPSRPKLLFLAHRVPYPPNRGDRIRSFHFLQYLAARSDVDLAYLDQCPPRPETSTALGALCRRVAAVPLGRYRRWLSATCSFAGGKTATEGLFSSAELRRVVEDWAQETRYDAIFVFCSSMVQYVDLPGLNGVPVVVDLVDVDSQKWFDYARQSWGPKRWLYQVEGQRLRRLEGELPTRAASILLASEREARLYRSFCPADCIYPIPNGVDLEYFHPSSSAVVDGLQRCVFIGALDYQANLDGVDWFCREVWPEAHRRRPQARFLLVGSNPGPVAKRLGRLPGVELVGEVSDVRPYLAHAAVVVVPLRVARGIQNKVLEALAMGKAVIASPQAAEGLAVEAGVHLCRAATAEEWIEAILQVLDDSRLSESLGKAGRCRMEERYAWGKQFRALASVPGLAELGLARTHCLSAAMVHSGVEALDSHASAEDGDR